MKYPNKFELRDRYQPETDSVKVTYNEYEDNFELLYDCGSTVTYNKVNIDNFVELFYDVVLLEPELVFPFTYKHATLEDECYEVVKDAQGVVRFCCQNSGWVSTVPDLYSEDEIKGNIKKGIWLVQSVGEQTPVEAPPSPSKDISTLTIKVDAKAAVEAVKELTEALEHLEKVYNRVKGIFNV